MQKTRRTAFFISISVSLFLLFSCGIPWAPTTGATIPADVYVAGAYGGPSSYACYWVNGAQTVLDADSYVNAIFVDDAGTVYTAGSHGTSTSYACCWKQTTRVDLETTVPSCAQQIRKSGTEVIVLGWVSTGSSRTACVWTINDTTWDVTGRTDYAWTATEGLYFMYGSDIYSAGTQVGTADHAAYYKKNNGTAVICPGASPRLSGLWTNGTDFYLYGDLDQEACYWKNGTRTDLDGTTAVTAVTTSGSDVYAAAYATDVTGPYRSVTNVIYYKNGKPWQLPGEDALSKAIQVVGGVDVYNAGWSSYQSAQTACYWVNGTKVDLPGPAGYSTSWAGSMVVVPR